METKTIKYRAGYKYQLRETYIQPLDFRVPDVDVSLHDYLCIQNGHLRIMAGYAWDGPSGPTVDTTDFMRGSLVHDALYQLMRDGLLSKDLRPKADLLLQQMCIDDGMPRFRADYVYMGVRIFGGSSASETTRKTLTAP